jgi:hypothetical protein
MDGKIWQRTHASGIALRLSGLEDTPDDVISAFEFFLGRPLTEDAPLDDEDDDFGPRALN